MPEPPLAGALLVDKPAGVSSFGAIARLRRAYGRRLGHTGTLDPFATGLLVVLHGRATRLAPLVAGGAKRYVATVRFGATSTTDDPEGEIAETGSSADRDRLVEALPGQIGEKAQLVVGDQIAAGIRRARNAHRRHIGCGVQILKIHMVFEPMRPRAGNTGLRSQECPRLERLVRIADVFRHEGKEDPPLFPRRAVGRLSREEVEELEEGGLAARSDCDVFRSDGPSELPP